MNHHGICVPLTAIHSKKSCGVGEFFDLIPLIDWAKNVGLDCIQLLPLNDSGNDVSPYNALSSCALDPVYLSLHELGPVDLFQAFRSLERIAFLDVKRQKLRWLHAYFEQTFAALSQTPEYKAFLQEHTWLKSYALFKTLKDEYGGKSWQEWPTELQNPDTVPPRNTDFHQFVQYHCFAQMEKVRAYADKRGVKLKGDIPILLSPDSVDVWAERHLFRLDLVAGAPPDLYNALGQKWGFPLFNWDALRATQFAWWKRRLKVAGHCFHIYRIDHVVGFFRIWAIPKNKKAIDGFFIPEDHNLWPAQGREILEMLLKASPLTPIAEDLGVIPPEVPIILKELGICGTKVVRWQRHWHGDKSFIPYDQYEPLSLTTVSTPDMDPLSLWWKKAPDEAIAFAHFKNWSYDGTLSSEHLFELLYDAHHTPSHYHINMLQEYLRLFPELSWPNLEDDRINVPGTLLPTNWTFRYRPSLEEMLEHQGLNVAMRKIADTVCTNESNAGGIL